MDFPDSYLSVSLKRGKAFAKSIKFPKEKLKENSLVIKILYMGICRADVKEVVGSRDIPEDRGPLFGHEFVGEIVYSGRDTNFKEGGFITFNPNITPKRTTGFAEYFFIEGDNKILDKAIIRIDKNLLDPIWQPEPFASTIHSVRKLLEHTNWNDFENRNVAILGSGNSGTMLGQHIRHLGGDVIMFNRGKMRRDFLVKRRFFTSDKVKDLENVSEHNNQFDIVVAVPTKIERDILELSFKLIKQGGYLLLYGGTRKEDRFLDSDIKIDSIRRNETSENVNYNGKQFYITGAYGAETEDFEKAMELYKEYNDHFPLQRLISKEVSLQEFPELINKMSTGETDYPGKILVKPQNGLL